MNDPALAAFNRLFGSEFGHGKAFDHARLHATLNQLGAPQTKLAPVFHIAGTNGKGSTIAFLRAIAEAADLRVHAFTKPHLFALRERFIIGGKEAADEALIDAAKRIAAIDQQLTHFDAQVAAAFLLFSQTPADLTLIETGMGGRDDSTNIIAKPALSIITPIGLDHQDALGATLADIATHKAGILKPGAPAISARQSPEALEVIEREAERLNAPLWRQGIEWDAYANAGRLIVQTEDRALDLPLPTLHGAHQIDNAGLACAAFLAATFSINDASFARGVSEAEWPARLQPLTKGALAEAIPNGEIWVDGGHNAHAAEALARALADMHRKRPAQTVLIIGLRARKDAAAFVQALAPQAQQIIALPLSEDHIAPEQLATLARNAGVTASTAPSLEAAIKNAAQFPAPRVLICGSLLLAAQALAAEA